MFSNSKLILILCITLIFKGATLHSCSPSISGDISYSKKVLDNHPRLSIVSHHKSGTVAAAMLVANLCCNASFNITKHWEFWDYFKSNTCKASCATKLILTVDGAPSWLECLYWGEDTVHPSSVVPINNQNHRFLGSSTASSSLMSAVQASHHIVHFVRHPVDMLISGYLYHRKCPETWTSRAKLDPKRIPLAMFEQIKRSSKSYCHYLNSVNTRIGLQSELNRTLGAKDGIGRMMLDFVLFQQHQQIDASSSKHSGVVTISSPYVSTLCLEQFDDGSKAWIELLEQLGVHEANWRRFRDEVREDHSTVIADPLSMVEPTKARVSSQDETADDDLVMIAYDLLISSGLLMKTNHSVQKSDYTTMGVNLEWVLKQYNKTTIDWAIGTKFPCKSKKKVMKTNMVRW